MISQIALDQEELIIVMVGELSHWPIYKVTSTFHLVKLLKMKLTSEVDQN